MLLLFLALLALYACAGAAPLTLGDKTSATANAINEKPAAAAGNSEISTLPTPAGGMLTAANAAETRHVPAVLPTEKPFPHIALLLPLKSATFGSAADAVRQGFFAAANYKRQMLPVRVYSNFDENSSVVYVYRQAIANGALAVVGPLTRNGVGALASEKDIPVPTLALNIVEGQFAPQLYFFGMAVELEARQVAQLAKKQHLHQAIVISTRSQLSQRLQSAFEEEWTGPSDGMDRGILREIEFNDDPAVFADIADITDTMVFLAADADRARMIRPYLPNKLPIYATSQIFLGNDNTLVNYDLNGISFVDMPWLLQPDHPAVMIYSRSNPPLSADHERLYALGIDSYRLIQLILANQSNNVMQLDGVSGLIQRSGHTFQHMAVPAVFAQGRAQLADESTPAPHVLPDQVIKMP